MPSFVALSVFLLVTVGVFLLLHRSLLRVVLGLGCISHAVNLIVLSAGRLAQRAPLAYVSEPLFRFRREGQESIVAKSVDQSPADLQRTARAVEKHREWLGERHYRLRLAVYLLRFLGRRRSKLPFIWHAVKTAAQDRSQC